MKRMVSLVGIEDNGSVSIHIKSEDRLATSAVLMAAAMQLAKEMDVPFGFLLNGWKEMYDAHRAKEAQE